jgi:hypothetical protein
MVVRTLLSILQLPTHFYHHNNITTLPQHFHFTSKSPLHHIINNTNASTYITQPQKRQSSCPG